MLLHMEQEIAAFAHGVEIRILCDLFQGIILGKRQNLLPELSYVGWCRSIAVLSDEAADVLFPTGSRP